MVCTFNNFSVIIGDVLNDNKIYDCNVPSLKGKTIRWQPKRIQTEYIEVPEILRGIIGNLMVTYDIMFMNNISFVFSVFRGVNFTMVEYVIRRLNTALNSSIVKIFSSIKQCIYYTHVSDGQGC